jgi:hypothetical protein
MILSKVLETIHPNVSAGILSKIFGEDPPKEVSTNQT